MRAEENDGRKLFHLTDAGREAATAAAADGAPWEAVSDSVDSEVFELFNIGRQVAMAIVRVARGLHARADRRGPRGPHQRAPRHLLDPRRGRERDHRDGPSPGRLIPGAGGAGTGVPRARSGYPLRMAPILRAAVPLLCLAATAIAAPAALARPADPGIETMRMWMTSHGGDTRVHVRLKVCALAGPSKAVLRQTKTSGGGVVYARGKRTAKFTQGAHCQRHTFRWKLRIEFFGVGTYKVAARVIDADGRRFNTVSRKSTVID